jgi:hypothetical protein
MDATNFPIPFVNTGACDDAYEVQSLLNIVGLFLEKADRGMSAETCADVNRVLNQAREVLDQLCVYLQDQPHDPEAYRQARRKHIVARSKLGT